MRSIPYSIGVQHGIHCIISCILQKTDIAEERKLAFVQTLSLLTVKTFPGPVQPDEDTFQAMKMYWVSCVLKNFECLSQSAQLQLLGREHSVMLLDGLLDAFDMTLSRMLSLSLTSERSLKDTIWIGVGVFLHTISASTWSLVQTRLLSHYLKVRQEATCLLILDFFEIVASKGTFLHWRASDVIYLNLGLKLLLNSLSTCSRAHCSSSSDFRPSVHHQFALPNFSTEFNRHTTLGIWKYYYLTLHGLTTIHWNSWTMRCWSALWRCGLFRWL